MLKQVGSYYVQALVNYSAVPHTEVPRPDKFLGMVIPNLREVMEDTF